MTQQTAGGGAILLRNTMAFDRAHVAEFRRAILSAVEFAKQNAPQLMVQVYIDEAQGRRGVFAVTRRLRGHCNRSGTRRSDADRVAP